MGTHWQVSLCREHTSLTPSLRTQCYPKFFNKNGEISVPQIVCVFTVAGAGRPGAQSGRLGTGGDATVPVQVEGVGAQHAQGPQGLQSRSHQQRHRLHLRSTDGAGCPPPCRPRQCHAQQQQQQQQQQQ